MFMVTRYRGTSESFARLLIFWMLQSERALAHEGWANHVGDHVDVRFSQPACGFHIRR